MQLSALGHTMMLMDTTCKDKVLAYLEHSKGAFVSGGKIASELGVSRNAVWKAVRALEAEGHDIESVTGKGYRLAATSSVLSAASIQHYLHHADVVVEYHDSIDSTNTRCKALAESGAAHGVLVVADQQTAGRGRQGRPFFSPAGTGIYFSLLLRPAFSLSDVSLITTYTAAVVAHIIEEQFDVVAQIKWVNDVFADGHKICGILTEASFDAESGSVAYVVVGIGINVHAPHSGFPDDVADVAHALDNKHADDADQRAKLVAAIVDAFLDGYETIPERSYLDAYRQRSLLDGRDVEVFEGARSYRARVLGIDDDFSLRVKCADGTERTLAAGEVHIPSSQL